MSRPEDDGIRINGNFLMSKGDYYKWITGEWTEEEMKKAYPQYKKNYCNEQN